MESIEADIRKFIVEVFLYGDDDGTITTDSSLLGTGVIDSTGVVELVAFVEKTFGISVADAEVIPDNVDSIKRLGKFIRRKRAAAGQPV